MKKRFLTGIMAAAMVMSAAFAMDTITADAAGLTQLEDASQVNYEGHGSEFTQEDIVMLEGMFDYDYYAENNSDVVYAIEQMLGDNYSEEDAKNILFVHFCKYGLYEGRDVSKDFNVSAFSSAYPDLKQALGKNILSYYKYAATHDLAAEGRTITTLKAAADAGITVEFVANSDIKVTPEVYFKAESAGMQSLNSIMVTINNTETYTEPSENNTSNYVAPSVEQVVNNVVAFNEFVQNNKIDTIKNITTEVSDRTYYIVCDRNGKYAVVPSLDQLKEKYTCNEGYDPSNTPVENYNTINVEMNINPDKTPDEGYYAWLCGRFTMNDKERNPLSTIGGNVAVTKDQLNDGIVIAVEVTEDGTVNFQTGHGEEFQGHVSFSNKEENTSND